jgi:hypothetical protein
MNQKNKVIGFIYLLTGWFTITGAFAQDYYYYYFEKRIYLTEVDGKYAIRFSDEISDIEQKSFLEGLNLKILGSARSIWGYTLARSDDSSTDILAVLKNYSFIIDAMPLLKFDDGIECMVPNRFIVKYKLSMTREDIDKLNAEKGVSIIEKQPYSEDIYILKVDGGGGLDALAMANQYHHLPDIEFAEPDLAVFGGPLEVTPNDPFFANQWHLNKIKAPNGWDITKGSSSVVAAVVDDGVDLLHEDLMNRFYRDGGGNIIGIDVTTQGDNNPQPKPFNAHGTAYAGIIAAETNNQKGVAGVGWM